MANEFKNATEFEAISVGDGKVGIYGGEEDPTITGFDFPVGSFYMRTNGKLYKKIETETTGWELIPRHHGVLVVSNSESKFYDGIKEAVDSISDAGPYNKYTVYVMPGLYIELPFTVPSYVYLKGAVYGSVDIAAATTGDFITMSQDSNIENFNINGPSSGSIITVTNGINTIFITNINFVSNSSNQAVYVDGLGSYPILENCKFLGTGIGIRNTNQGYVDTIQCYFLNDNIGILGESNSEIFAFNSYFSGCSSAIKMDGSSKLMGISLYIKSCTNGLITGTNGTNIIKAFLLYEDSVSNLMIDQQTASGVIELHYSYFSDNKINISNWNKVNFSYDDIEEGESRFVFSHSMSVGVPELGRTTSLGEGDFYTREMLVYTFNGSTFTNMSTAAASYSGSTFGFPNLNTNTAIYFSTHLQDSNTSEHLQFFGIETQIIEQEMILGTGGAIFEYWDGTNWIEFPVMVTKRERKYFPYGNTPFERLQPEQIRFPDYLQDRWVKNDPISDGTDKYWVRFRITGVITQSMVIEKIKLHTSINRLETDGFTQFYGTSRPIQNLNWDLNLSEKSGGDPADQDIYLSTGLGVGRQKNAFSGNIDDRIGLNLYLPYNIDTSCPIRLKLSWIPLAAGSNDTIQWTIRWGFSKDGEIIYETSNSAPTAHSSEQELIVIDDVPETSNMQTTSTFELDIRDAIARRDNVEGDMIWVSVQRNGGSSSNDTFTSYIALLNIAPYYTSWCQGGHF